MTITRARLNGLIRRPNSATSNEIVGICEELLDRRSGVHPAEIAEREYEPRDQPEERAAAPLLTHHRHSRDCESIRSPGTGFCTCGAAK